MPSLGRSWCGWLAYIWGIYGVENFAKEILKYNIFTAEIKSKK